ncbi:MAG TPA: clostripain-related cysteine peptidase [Pyrinomonadaceae bacterium]|nr:clostripain-related cysteine peptidase [Pyrinomonadaceae bacterium]
MATKKAGKKLPAKKSGKNRPAKKSAAKKSPAKKSSAKKGASKQLVKKEWTMMVYMCGDNNLDSAGMADLKEMKKIGSTDKVSVVVQYDRSGNNHHTRRYYVRKGGVSSNDVVQTLGETNMGDPKVLEDFINWGLKNYPAKRYIVVLWNHGEGWDDTDIYHTARRSLRADITRRGEVVDAVRGIAGASVSTRRLRTVGKRFKRALFRSTIEQALSQPMRVEEDPRSSGVILRAICLDDDAEDFLDNIELRKVVSSVHKKLGRPLDILGMDACLMSMAEVCYQLREDALVTIGSEQTEPGDGWPYDTILGYLAGKPTATPQELAVTIVNNYMASYPANAGVTQAACDLTKSDLMAEAVDRLAKALKGKLSNPNVLTQIVLARHRVQSYDVEDNIDLYDFCELLRQSVSDAEITAACKGVMDVIGAQGFVLNSGFKGTNVKNSHGLAIYFPTKQIINLYDTNLEFTKKTQWSAFLKAYLSSTGR